MGTNKVKIILIVLLVVAMILLGVFWFLSSQNAKQDVINLVDNQTQDIPEDVKQENMVAENNVKQPETSESEIKDYISKISKSDKLKAQLQKFTIAFVERYGSYSNQSNFENLEDLLVFMTHSLRTKTADFINLRRRQQRETAIYHGMTTKVLNSKIENFSVDTNFIKLNISTQKQEMIGSSINTNTFYQNVDVELKQEGGIWKVNKITWL